MSSPRWTEEMFRALTAHSADIISVLDRDGRLVFNSAATLRINGFTPEELQARDTFELVHPDDRARVAQVFAEVVAAPGAVHTVEYRYQTKDGRWLWMEAVASNQLDNPAVRGVVANSRDVSERKRAEEERAALEQQVLHVQKLESLGLLAGGVAHDFNNLLSVILAELNLMKATRGADESMDNIEQAARRAADLAQQLLVYAGRRAPLMVVTDVAEQIRDVLPLLRLSTRGDAELRLELEPGVPHVRCDRGQLRQILLNLVINASEALTGPGTITLRLRHHRVSADELRHGQHTGDFPPGPAVVLQVEDTGAGMTAELMRRIFDPFFSTRQTGRGLGLAAVVGIVRAHQAGLSVTSTAGRGAVFTVYLRESSTPPTAPSLRAVRFSGRVLVIDDEPLVASTTARLLGAVGLSCATALGGARAIERFEEAPAGWTLVVCDVLMPGINGPQAVARLRATRPDLPVLYVSGYAPDPAQLRLDDRTRFLSKPFDPEALFRELAALTAAP